MKDVVKVVEVNGVEVANTKGSCRVSAERGFNVIVVDTTWDPKVGVSFGDVARDLLAIFRGFAVALRESCVAKVRIGAIVWKAGGIACFANVSPV